MSYRYSFFDPFSNSDAISSEFAYDASSPVVPVTLYRSSKDATGSKQARKTDKLEIQDSAKSESSVHGTLDYAGKGVVAVLSSTTAQSLLVVLGVEEDPSKGGSLALTISQTACKFTYTAPLVVHGAPTALSFPEDNVKVLHGDTSCFLRTKKRTPY